ncbi:hypothetical protein INT45_000035 [Circinella minor]|uniref:Uncharacterized protein n=1 Tax=Circinella minor TaxID=1195481 RepID=A0A8H7RNW3_9FUNG|nr:hypothetical protein INT45_000035 [Circinella minor]
MRLTLQRCPKCFVLKQSNNFEEHVITCTRIPDYLESLQAQIIQDPEVLPSVSLEEQPGILQQDVDEELLDAHSNNQEDDGPTGSPRYMMTDWDDYNVDMGGEMDVYDYEDDNSQVRDNNDDQNTDYTHAGTDVEDCASEEAYDTTDPYVTNTVEPTIANEEYVDAWENEPPLCTNEPIAYTEYAPVPLDNHEKKSFQIYCWIQENNISRGAYEELVKLLNKWIKDDDIPRVLLLSPYKTESDLGKLFDLQEVKYCMCPKGCRLFPKGSSSPCKCEAP